MTGIIGLRLLWCDRCQDEQYHQYSGPQRFPGGYEWWTCVVCHKRRDLTREAR